MRSVHSTTTSSTTAAVVVDLGTTDKINDNVVVGGLAITERLTLTPVVNMEVDTVIETPVEVPIPTTTTLEERALRELVAGGIQLANDQPELILHSAADNRTGPLEDSGDAFKNDLNSRPDEVSHVLFLFTSPSFQLVLTGSTRHQSSLDDYARIPVGTFGLALLRGMGWTPGTAASRTGRAGPVEAFVPSSRPALLGIGAKPMAEVLGVEKGKNGKPVRVDRREEMKFVPLIKRERESASSSARSVRSLFHSHSLSYTPAWPTTNESKQNRLLVDLNPLLLEFHHDVLPFLHPLRDQGQQER